MNDQLAMQFEPRRVETPVSRRNDPESSHLAAEHVTQTGLRAIQQAQTVDAVRQHPWCTSQELAALTGLDRYMLARRLSECETAGTVQRRGIVVCSITRHKALTWGAT